jgi:hypothetical protein
MAKDEWDDAKKTIGFIQVDGLMWLIWCKAMPGRVAFRIRSPTAAVDGSEDFRGKAEVVMTNENRLILMTEGDLPKQVKVPFMRHINVNWQNWMKELEDGERD